MVGQRPETSKYGLLNISIDITFVTVGENDTDKHVDEGQGGADEASGWFQHPE